MFFFFFNDTATTEIYTLSLHDALPICDHRGGGDRRGAGRGQAGAAARGGRGADRALRARRDGARHGAARRGRDPAADQERSEEHTSELQSRQYLVCRLLLEKKKKKKME